MRVAVASCHPSLAPIPKMAVTSVESIGKRTISLVSCILSLWVFLHSDSICKTTIHRVSCSLSVMCVCSHVVCIVSRHNLFNTNKNVLTFTKLMNHLMYLQYIYQSSLFSAGALFEIDTPEAVFSNDV